MLFGILDIHLRKNAIYLTYLKQSLVVSQLGQCTDIGEKLYTLGMNIHAFQLL